MLTAFAATLIIFAIPSGLLATRIGRKPTIIIGLSGMVLGTLAAYLVRNPTAEAQAAPVSDTMKKLLSAPKMKSGEEELKRAHDKGN